MQATLTLATAEKHFKTDGDKLLFLEHIELDALSKQDKEGKRCF